MSISPCLNPTNTVLIRSFFTIMMILNVKSELGLFWQNPNCQAFWSVLERAFFIRMTTCFNSIDCWAPSQQKSLYEDIYSIIWSFGWRLYPRYSHSKFINTYILVTQAETFSFPPFPSLHLLSSNTKQQSNAKLLLIRSILHHTLKSHVITTGDKCLVISYKILFRNFDVLCQSGRCTQSSPFIWHLKCRIPFCTRCAFINNIYITGGEN